MFSNTVFAGETEHIVNAKPIDGYKINATAPAVFESLTPDLVEIVRQDGQNVEINLHGEGDGYIAIHYRSGHEFIYHFIIKKDADDVSKFSVHDVAQQVLALVNEERRKAGVAPLKLSAELQSAAAIRAEEITRRFSHTRPDGNNTAAKVVQQWMNSPGHRANILRSDYTELGVGYAYKENSQYKHYWVQIFRRPMPGR